MNENIHIYYVKNNIWKNLNLKNETKLNLLMNSALILI